MNKNQRKSTRLPNYNYFKTAYYFITTCTYQHKCTLATIEGQQSSIENLYATAVVKLTKYGSVVDKSINELLKKYPNISICYYVIMPNHLHLIVEQKNGRESSCPTTNITNIMGYFKYQTTKLINEGNNNIIKIWQRSFYDHIIRNKKDYLRIVKYIKTNPLKWQLDKYYKLK